MNHPKNESTLVLIKPDGVQRSLIGEIIGRYERVGLKLIAMKMIVVTREFIEEFYTLDPEWKLKTGEKNLKAYKDKGLTNTHNDPIEVASFILEKLKIYYTSGPIVAMVWEGAHAVAVVRKLTGSTEPVMSDVGTIRGDFVLDSYKMADDDLRSIRNLVHASGSVKEAEAEVGHWFSEQEIIKYRHVQEKILYDVNIDGIEE
ncbi:MAG: nucleoside-diphosphate kinase [bacterium]|nr:nucleoside-diphosphate kinase [bacterium]